MFFLNKIEMQRQYTSCLRFAHQPASSGNIFALELRQHLVMKAVIVFGVRLFANDRSCLAQDIQGMKLVGICHKVTIRRPGTV